MTPHTAMIVALCSRDSRLRRYGFRKAVVECALEPYLEECEALDSLPGWREEILGLVPDCYLIDKERSVIECVEVLDKHREYLDKYALLVFDLQGIGWTVLVHAIDARTGAWEEEDAFVHALKVLRNGRP